ncbi:MAG: 50S ribosomal protein L23 [Candidatus Peribacteria bacterium]|nr:MAG: 50S ribosomal protein L23 [Candidatus Peribacteria bacterium]
MTYKDILRKRAEKVTSLKALKTLHPCQIVGTPMITEKAYKQVESLNTYFFRVHKDANKNDVKACIQSLYNVEPTSVRIVNVPYKGRMQRKLVRRAFKKAIVTLKKDDKIELAA